MAWVGRMFITPTQFVLRGMDLRTVGPAPMSDASFERIADVVYLSGTTYTTLGTGKHLLMPPYCVLEPMEATNGILAAGLNAAILFAIVSNVARRSSDYDEFFW